MRFVRVIGTILVVLNKYQPEKTCDSNFIVTRIEKDLM
jgi:hypothetical protein